MPRRGGLSTGGGGATGEPRSAPRRGRPAGIRRVWKASLPACRCERSRLPCRCRRGLPACRAERSLPTLSSRAERGTSSLTHCCAQGGRRQIPRSADSARNDNVWGAVRRAACRGGRSLPACRAERGLPSLSSRAERGTSSSPHCCAQGGRRRDSSLRNFARNDNVWGAVGRAACRGGRRLPACRAERSPPSLSSRAERGTSSLTHCCAQGRRRRDSSLRNFARNDNVWGAVRRAARRGGRGLPACRCGAQPTHLVVPSGARGLVFASLLRTR